MMLSPANSFKSAASLRTMPGNRGDVFFRGDTRQVEEDPERLRIRLHGVRDETRDVPKRLLDLEALREVLLKRNLLSDGASNRFWSGGACCRVEWV